MATQASYDFLAQEPLNLGHGGRESQPTVHAQYYAEMQGRRNASLNACQQRHNAQVQQGAASQVEPNPVHFPAPLQALVVPTEQASGFNASTANLSMQNTNYTGPGQQNIARPDLNAEELQEMYNNPDADTLDAEQDELTEFQKRLAVDDSLLDDFPACPSQITSTPVALPTPRIACWPPRAASPHAAPLTPLTGGRPCHAQLTRRTHLLPPTPSPLHTGSANHDKENVALMTAAGTLQADTLVQYQVGEKRRRANGDDGPPEDDSPGDNEPEDHGRLRACDLNPAQRRILDGANPCYFMELSKNGPYPSPVDEDIWATRSWFASLNHLIANSGYATGNTVPTQGEIDLIKARVHNVRGSVCAKARELLVPQFGFLRGGELASINHNRQLVELLLDHNSFTYHNPSNRGECESIFRNDIIRNIIHQVWFGDKSQSLALLYPEFFVDTIPLETIAFVITCVHCAVTEFSQGVQTNVKFDTKIYQPAYEQYLKTLHEWYDFTEARGSKSTRNLQTQLFLTGREFAGVNVHVASQQVYAYTHADFEADKLE